jgi:uncharacterized protein YecE (DUF72 family)
MLRIGTSAFTAAGWEGTFYPAGLKPRDYITHYATHFDTVEVDATFYRIPAPSTVRGWRDRTPDGFLFALKAPQVITHEKVLAGAEADLKQFLAVADILEEKLGPILFQFPYFNRKAFARLEDFLARLVPFLEKLPRGQRFAVEIRNKNWLAEPLTAALRKRGVALALVDHPWLPRPSELLARLHPVTAPFTYVRWLGDRKGIEEQTRTWDKTIVNRRRELAEWVDVLRKLSRQRVEIFGYANNHFAGHAPATVRQFLELWNKR